MYLKVLKNPKDKFYKKFLLNKTKWKIIKCNVKKMNNPINKFNKINNKFSKFSKFNNKKNKFNNYNNNHFWTKRMLILLILGN